MPKVLTHQEQVERKLGKRPQSATQIAAKLGKKSHHAVARQLGKAVAEGRAVKTEKGYQSA